MVVFRIELAVNRPTISGFTPPLFTKVLLLAKTRFPRARTVPDELVPTVSFPVRNKVEFVWLVPRRTSCVLVMLPEMVADAQDREHPQMDYRRFRCWQQSDWKY